MCIGKTDLDLIYSSSVALLAQDAHIRELEDQIRALQQELKMKDISLNLRNKKIITLENQVEDLNEEMSLTQFNLEETEMELRQRMEVIRMMKGAVDEREREQLSKQSHTEAQRLESVFGDGAKVTSKNNGFYKVEARNHGERKGAVLIRSINGALMVRVGGGYQTLADYLETHGDPAGGAPRSANAVDNEVSNVEHALFSGRHVEVSTNYRSKGNRPRSSTTPNRAGGSPRPPRKAATASSLADNGHLDGMNLSPKMRSAMARVGSSMLADPEDEKDADAAARVLTSL